MNIVKFAVLGAAPLASGAIVASYVAPENNGNVTD